MTDISLASPAVEQIDGEPDVSAEATRIHDGLAALAALAKPAPVINSAISELSNPSDAIPGDDQLAAWLNTQIPAGVLQAAPSNLTPLDLFQWKIKAAVSAQVKASVPVTDTRRPALLLGAVDLSTLPAHARMANGYTSARKV